MEVRRWRWYVAVLVLPSEGFGVKGMTAYEGVVAVVALFSTQAMISVV
jgi:hypothetical protein